MLQRTLLAAFLGALLGWCLGWFAFHGYLTHWQLLPVTPLPITTIVRAFGDVVYVQATDGEIYGCTVQSASCWTRVPKDRLSDLPAQTHTMPCSTITVAFAFTTAPPPNIRACLASEQTYADGEGMFLFALSDDRRLWHWQLIHSAYDRPRIIFTVLGTLGGLLVGGLIVCLRAVRRLLIQRQINHDEAVIRRRMKHDVCSGLAAQPGVAVRPLRARDRAFFEGS